MFLKAFPVLTPKTSPAPLLFEALRYFRNELKISGEPIHIIKMFQVKPAGCLVLTEMQVAAFYFADKAIHRKVKRRVIPLHRPQQPFHPYLRVQLLADFANQSLLRALPGFYFPARELPSILKISISTLRRENPSVLDDYRRNHPYSFHPESISK